MIRNVETPESRLCNRVPTKTSDTREMHWASSADRVGLRNNVQTSGDSTQGIETSTDANKRGVDAKLTGSVTTTRRQVSSISVSDRVP